MRGRVRTHRQVERREGIKLSLVSLLFVVGGGFLWFGLGQPMGLVAIAFFGACLLVGLVQIGGTDTRVGRWALVVGALVLGLGCGLAALVMFVDPGAAPPGRSAALGVIVGVVGFGFFFGGGLLVLIRRMSGRDRRWQLR